MGACTDWQTEVKSLFASCAYVPPSSTIYYDGENTTLWLRTYFAWQWIL